MPDARKNFAVSVVVTPPAPGTTGTSLQVKAGTGKRFPTTPFNATLAPEKETATEDNAEIVRVTAIATDTFTIVRTQEGTVAKEIAFGYRIYAGQTDKVLKDIEAGVAGPAGATGATGPPGNELALGVAVTASRSLKTTDAGKSLDCNNGSIIVITLKKHSLEAIAEGFVAEILQRNQAVRVQPEAGVSTIPATPAAGYYETNELGSIIGVRKIDNADAWVISGDWK